MPAWWYDDWQAEPTPARPSTAKLMPIVTTAQHIDAVELAQIYIRRWPLQENVIRDYLLLAAGSTRTTALRRHLWSIRRTAAKRAALEKRLNSIKRWAVSARERSHRASLRYTRLWKETKAKGEERYRVLDKQLQALEAQGVSPGQWRSERNRLKAEADSELQELWQRVYRVLDTSNKEHAKWERYSREQCDLLRALEDLAAQERTMYELDNRKDQIMTVCKVALANLGQWV